MEYGGGKKEDTFMEGNMMRNEDFIGLKIKRTPTFLTMWVSN